MTIKDLFKYLQDSDLIIEYSNITDNKIQGISDDSRKISKDDAFIAIKGLKVDANDYIDDVLKKGVNLIISENEIPQNIINSVAYIRVKNARKALSLSSSYWYGNPSEKLKIIAVTGTKGKTTVVHLIYHILKKLGYRVGMISTIKAVVGESVYDTGLHVTNPEPLLLQKLLREMVDKNLEYVVLEVTSHGLDQDRIYGVEINTAVITNITKEHLDYHKTFSKYRSTKFKLLEGSDNLILNADDDSYALFINKLINKKITTYAQRKKADITGKVLSIDGDDMKYEIKTGEAKFTGSIALLGVYNLYNILASISAVSSLGIKPKKILETLVDFEPPEGRLEKIKNKKGLDIYIDFAHTPDSLENLLLLLKEKKKGRLISVFGCAGERDRRKRFEMGKISGKLSDVSVITAEDPRSENVLDICNEIKRGAIYSKAKDYFLKINNGSLYLVIPDRFEAIYYAINKIAEKNDTVVICGKGHEKSMCYDDIEHPWSDSETIKIALSTKYDKAVIVLAAGEGKRLQSNLPKVVNKLAGKPIISYTLNNLRESGFKNIVIVVGHKSDVVIDEIGPTYFYAYQKKQLGTGNAAQIGIEDVNKKYSDVLIVNGDDSAFYKPATFSNVWKYHENGRYKLTFVSVVLKNPHGLGRIVRDNGGSLLKIVEEKNANDDEKKIKEVNTGLYIFEREWLLDNIKKVKMSDSGEYYITDLIKLAVKQGDRVGTYVLKDSSEWYGINTKEQLDWADTKMRKFIEYK